MAPVASVTGLQLVVAPELSPHLARALAVHLRWCRDNGVPVADGLVELQKWAEVVARGLSSPLALLGGDDLGAPHWLLSWRIAQAEAPSSMRAYRRPGPGPMVGH